MNSLTLHDHLSGKDVQLSWADVCAIIISAENPSEFVSNKDRQQLLQIANQFREFLD